LLAVFFPKKYGEQARRLHGMPAQATSNLL
jgi:hypothetical protein